MQFSYSRLALATHSFSEESKLGEGTFGAVYKGIYDGQEVAVKKMIKTERANPDDFHRELQTISNTNHKNLVRLKGWCGKTSLIDATSCWKRIKVELLIVFEFIPNGSLEDHLYKREQVLPWEKRYFYFEQVIN
jgi:serine/threonine protein kinase